MSLTPELLADLRKKARDAEDETDCTQPHDIDALSPKADKTETMHAALPPSVVLALLDRIDALEKDKAEALTGLREAHATLKRVNAGLKRLRALDGAV